MKFFLVIFGLYFGSIVVVAQDADCPPGEVLIDGKCGKCPPGRFYHFLYKSCRSCYMGSFKAGEGQGDCLDCPFGMFSLESSSECVSCPEGEALMRDGTCGVCEPGSFYIVDEGKCMECPQNSFQPSANVRTSCYRCAGHTHSSRGSTACTGCPLNQALMLNGTCGTCPPGSYYHRGRCKKCRRNTFTSETNVRVRCISCFGDKHAGPGATMCKMCPHGQVKMRNGKCGSCPAGSYLRNRNMGCFSCPPNTFQPRENVDSKCLRCAGNEYAKSGSTSCSRCPPNTAPMGFSYRKCGSCPPGKYYSTFLKECMKCGLNEFQPDENIRRSCFACSGDTFSLRGASSCTRCKANEVLMRDGNCSSCPAGTGFQRDSLSCRPCGYGRYGTGTGVDQACEECPRFHYSNRMSAECMTCPQGQGLIVKSGQLVECDSCPPGSVYDKYGSARCRRCNYGVSPGGNEQVCTDCKTGTIPNGERSECIS